MGNPKKAERSSLAGRNSRNKAVLALIKGASRDLKTSKKTLTKQIGLWKMRRESRLKGRKQTRKNQISPSNLR